MKAEEVRALSTDALQAKVNDAREELMKLRFQQATGEISDPNRLRYVRRDIARMLTILNQRAGEAEKEG